MKFSECFNTMGNLLCSQCLSWNVSWKFYVLFTSLFLLLHLLNPTSFCACPKPRPALIYNVICRVFFVFSELRLEDDCVLYWYWNCSPSLFKLSFITKLLGFVNYYIVKLLRFVNYYITKIIRVCKLLHCQIIRVCQLLHCQIIRVCQLLHWQIIRVCQLLHCQIMRVCKLLHNQNY